MVSAGVLLQRLAGSSGSSVLVAQKARSPGNLMCPYIIQIIGALG